AEEVRGRGRGFRAAGRDDVRLRHHRLGARLRAPRARPSARRGLRRLVDGMGRPHGHAGGTLEEIAMATTETYTLNDFVGDLDRITREETSATRVTERVSPLLSRRARHPRSVAAGCRGGA